MEKQDIRSHLDSIRCEMIHAQHGSWRLYCRVDRSRTDQPDPVDLKQFLGKLIISEGERDPFRIRDRLVGTTVVSAAGLDLTGRYLIAYGLWA
jgi:hypothetical protein